MVVAACNAPRQLLQRAHGSRRRGGEGGQRQDLPVRMCVCVPEVRNKTALLNMGATRAASPPDCFRPSNVPSHSARCPPQSSFQPLPHNAAHGAHPPAPAHVFPGQHKAMRLSVVASRNARREGGELLYRKTAGSAGELCIASKRTASYTSCLHLSLCINI